MATTQQGISNKSQDSVAILDATTFQPLFPNANPMRVSVRETSRLTSWAVEDGTQRTDHRVLDPVEIEIPFLLTNQSRALFEQLRQAFIAGTDLIVQGRARTYPKMMIYECPHEETPDQWEAIPVSIKMREVVVITAEFGALPPSKVASEKQASTVKKGNQQTEEADAPTQRKASALYEILN